MRAAPPSLLALGLGCLACTIDNPAFLATDGPESSGGTATTGSASTTGRTTTDATTDATTDGTTSTSTTASPSTTDPATTTADPSTTGTATTDPLTSGSSSGTTGDTTGDTSSSSDGSTTIADTCPLPVAPAFALGFSSTKAFNCNGLYQSVFYAEPLMADGPNAWKMRVCTDPNACKSRDSCFSQETVTLHFDGPPEFVPKLDNATCHQVGVLARGPDDDDPSVCRLRLLRLAHTGFDAPTVEFVGAVGVPDSEALPAPWPGVIPFAVAPKLALPCDGDPVCNGLLPGSYGLEVTWPTKMAMYDVPEGDSIAESISAKKNGVATEILGSFTNLSSHAPPGATCDDGLAFDWVWFTELLAP